MFLTIDQYGEKTIIVADKLTRRVLQETFCGGSVRNMYVDLKSDPSICYKVGYVVGQGHGNSSLWLRVFRLEPMRELQGRMD